MHKMSANAWTCMVALATSRPLHRDSSLWRWAGSYQAPSDRPVGLAGAGPSGVAPLLRVEEPPDPTVFLARGGPDSIASLRTAAFRTARRLCLDGEPLVGI